MLIHPCLVSETLDARLEHTPIAHATVTGGSHMRVATVGRTTRLFDQADLAIMACPALVKVAKGV